MTLVNRLIPAYSIESCDSCVSGCFYEFTDSGNFQESGDFGDSCYNNKF